MYKGCRHIKASGLPCKSRALAGANFCYFHSRFHNPVAGTESGPLESEPLKLPVLEDLASIPIAVARISEALIAGRIDVKVSAQLFWGLKLASLAIAGRNEWQPYSVECVTKSSEGDELAPSQIYCVREDDCYGCKDSKTCIESLYYVDPHEFEDEFEDDEDDDGQDQVEEEAGGAAVENAEADCGAKAATEDGDGDREKSGDKEQKVESSNGDSGGQNDDDDGDDQEDEDDVDDNLDNETTEELVADAQYLESVGNALDAGDMRQVARLLRE